MEKDNQLHPAYQWNFVRRFSIILIITAHNVLMNIELLHTWKEVILHTMTVPSLSILSNGTSSYTNSHWNVPQKQPCYQRPPYQKQTSPRQMAQQRAMIQQSPSAPVFEWKWWCTLAMVVWWLLCCSTVCRIASILLSISRMDFLWELSQLAIHRRKEGERSERIVRLHMVSLAHRYTWQRTVRIGYDSPSSRQLETASLLSHHGNAVEMIKSLGKVIHICIHIN